jgi:hypothetical protein
MRGFKPVLYVLPLVALATCSDLGFNKKNNDTTGPATSIVGVWKPVSISGTYFDASTMTSRDINAAYTMPQIDPVDSIPTEQYLEVTDTGCALYTFKQGSGFYGKLSSGIRSTDDSTYFFDFVDSLRGFLSSPILTSTILFKTKGENLVMSIVDISSNSGKIIEVLADVSYERITGAFPPATWPATAWEFSASKDVSALGKKATFNKMVPKSDCTPKPCECADLPMIDLFQKKQQQNLDAWSSIRNELLTNPPANGRDAVTRFNSRVTWDARVLAGCAPATGGRYELGSCDLSKGMQLDSCFCATRCDIMVNSVIYHEKYHMVANVGQFFGHVPVRIVARLGGSSSLEGNVEAADLTMAEIDCHTVQVGYLAAAKAALELSLGDSCTWDTLAKKRVSPASQAPTPLAKMLAGRVKLMAAQLFSRR